MKEWVCLKPDYTKIVLKAMRDAVIIFALLFLIVFIEYIMKVFLNFFANIISQKAINIIVVAVISLALAAIVAVIDVISRCGKIKADEEKLVLVKGKKEETMTLTADLYVIGQEKKNLFTFSFRQNKRVINADLSTGDGKALAAFLSDKGIRVNSIDVKRKNRGI